MEPQETRYQLARHGAQLEEIASKLSRLIDLSENIARIQEREADRDDKLARLVKKGDEQGGRIGALENRLTGSTSWARGVMAVITAVLLPVSGAVMWDVLHEIPAIDRRVQTLETQSHTPATGTK
ncbi:hypothetical protein P0D88_35035 [Paraburkholderia sp. RL18-103-BIB-C]|uniref:hypothetical protein n=1 Tax=Paraburkholderia sp. RL18-103-BIB-C TaxID=3031637 RepID=UPI0038B778A8